ncbi:MAG TPA: hypothetical protein PLD88_12820, partial [Candidatus Berkiella sp.]|nr:hypothetical protein [Candidatus Berkiella sp.]
MQWSEEIPPQLQCGEIIAVQNKSLDQKKIWLLGTIRWLRHEKDNTILFGVKILSHQILAVHAFLDETQHPTPTLLLAEEPLHNKPKTLITPLLPFKSGQEISIAFDNKTYPTLLQKNYSLSPCYQQFGVEFLLEQLLFPQSSTPTHA